MSEHHLLAVGLPYSTRRTWPEWAEYNYRSGGHELRLFLKSPTAQEIEDYTENELRFALATYNDIIYFCYKPDHGTWSDSGYSWHLVTEEERTIPDASDPGLHALLTIILVDANTGIVKGLRAVTLSPKFTAALEQAIIAQSSRPFPGPQEFAKQNARIYAQYTSRDIATKLSKVRCIGGE